MLTTDMRGIAKGLLQRLLLILPPLPQGLSDCGQDFAGQGEDGADRFAVHGFTPFRPEGSIRDRVVN